jgi:aryl carrier-like protein
MSKGLHIGRIAVSIREAPEEQLDLGGEIARRPIRPSFKSSASYLLIGGLGGLGRAISTWMVDNNAGELIYLSRGAGAGPADQAFVKELHSMGCDVKLVRGSVTELEDVNRAIQAATLPLKGIIQMSMVVRDRNLTVMTYEDWIGSVAPKVQGTWNLHNATMSAGIELDFFVLFSSLSGIFGQPGQANYASANTFLDAFSQYRKGLGLAASVIDLGSVADIGFFEKNQDLLELLRMVGFKGVPEQHMLDAMTAAVSPRPATKVDSGRSRFVAEDALLLGIGAAMPLSDPNNRAIWRDHRPMAIYHNEAGESGGSAKASNETLKSYLATVKADISILKTPEAANVFAVEIGRKLFDLLLNPEEEVNTSLPLVDLGLDSIVALELRSWWKQVFSFDISVLEMLGMGSLDALGQHATEGLLRIATEENGKSGSE